MAGKGSALKSSKSTLCLKSFEEIKDLLQTKSISFPDAPLLAPPMMEEEPDLENEENLFRQAMEGVTPIPRPNFVERGLPPHPPGKIRSRDDDDSLLQLRDLVERGTGFEVSDTPEYIEGTGYQVHPEVARRLHRGDYSIQAYVNLHRFKVSDAQDTFERFLKWAIETGKTGVLIVHGRGLSSPTEPVLKQRVVEWLTRGPWRKWIVAFASARSCDGGAGATYVLLRRRSVSKRFKRPK